MPGAIGETFATPDDFGDIRSSDLHASLGDRLAAQAADALDPQSGFSAMQIFRRTRAALAGGDISPPGLYTLGEAVPGDIELADQIRAAQKAAIPDTAIEDARKRVKEEGLEGHLKLPDQPSIKSPVLDLMVQEAHERRDRELAIARGPQGFAPDALGFVTGIGAGMIDPVNMAAFSIPVVGEARFGRMLASAGESLAARAAVRAGVGAAQGAVGTAVLQPADWWLHTQDGLDYTMTDALRSIVMGAGMGAAFHAGGGAIGDVLARRAGRPLPGSPQDLLARALAAPGRPAGEPGAAGLPSEAPPDFANAGTPGEEIPGIAPSTRATAQPIFEALRDQMVAAGRPEDEANQVAAVIAARYATRAQRLGRPDAEALAREAGIEIRPGGDLAEEGRSLLQIDAYHGSPHHFERFDISRIGTGEGAQAYGHGLYFAEDEGVAKGYKEKLSGTLPRSSVMSPEVLSEYFKPGEIVNTMWGRDRVLAYDPQTRRVTVQAVNGAGKPLEGIDGRVRTHTTTPEWNEVVSTFKQRGTPIPEVGALYKVSLKPDKEDLLDWDKPLSEQSEKVQKIARSMLDVQPFLGPDMRVMDALLADPKWKGKWDPAGEDRAWYYIREMFPNASEQHMQQIADRVQGHVSFGTVPASVSGERIYHALVRKYGAEGASKKLAEAGIPGLKYADAGSRASVARQLETSIADMKAKIAAAERDIAAERARGKLLPAYFERTASDIRDMQQRVAQWETRLGEVPAATHNFVIFSDKDIEITHRNGEPLTNKQRTDAVKELEDRRQAAVAEKSFEQRKTAPPGPDLFTQREAEGQANLPGTERISEAELAKRRGAEPLRPGVVQKPMDIGLFGDTAKQRELFQRVNPETRDLVTQANQAEADLRRALEGVEVGGGEVYPVDLALNKGLINRLPPEAKAAAERHAELSAAVDAKLEALDAQITKALEGVEVDGDPVDLMDIAVNRRLRESVPAEVQALMDERDMLTSNELAMEQRGGAGERGDVLGRVTFADNKRIVELFKSANASTAMHELGHVWFEELVADAGRADAPQALRDDLATVLKWLGVEKPEDIGTPHHEQFARGFEQYLRDGNAPSSALAAAFEKFKAWLTAIYRSLTELGTPISDEMRGVFDRMLATDAEIAAAHPASKLADLPPRVREDALRATVADITAGNTARTGEMLEEAAKEDPRIAESLRPRSLAAETPSGTTTVRQFGAFEPSASAPASAVRTGVPHIDAVLAQPDVAAAIADPRVNRSQDVPYTAGPDRTGPGLNIDRHLPATLTTASGKTFDPAKPYAVHEFVERHVINELIAGGMDQGTAYKVAHWEYAEPAEAAWYRANDIDPAEAEAAAQPHIDKIEHEKLAKGDGDVPPDLFRKPYPHDSVDAAAREKAPVPKPTADEIARGREILAQGQRAPEGAPAGDAVVHVKPKAARGPRARPEETWSLNEFIASKGGIDPADPMIADVRGSIGRPNKFVPGFGNLVAAPGKGVRLDRLREAAVEAGYIHDEGNVTGGLATSTVNTLLDAIDAELRGRRVYRQGIAAPERAVDPARHDHELNAYLDQELHAAGIDPDTVTGKYRDRVLEIMDRERQHPHDALERAAMEDTASGAEAGQVKPKPEAIPGWDVPDDTGSAPGAGGQVASGRDAAGQPAGRPARDRGQGGRSQGKADWQGLADARRPDDEDLAVASRQADKTPEPASLDPEKSPSAAEAAAREADALLAELLPRLSDDERRIFEDALARLDREKAADEAIARDGAACLAAAVA